MRKRLKFNRVQNAPIHEGQYLISVSVPSTSSQSHWLTLIKYSEKGYLSLMAEYDLGLNVNYYF